MALRNVLKGTNNTRLRKISRPVTVIDHRLLRLLADMRDTMRKNEGIGIAAPQVGVLKRVVVIDAEDDVIELINPYIVREDGRQTEAEGCLSVPNRRGIVPRPLKTE